jgi:hypothetical protein
MTNDSRKPDRAALEIEITEEMIEAGVRELLSYDCTAPVNPNSREAVEAIFSAMFSILQK